MISVKRKYLARLVANKKNPQQYCFITYTRFVFTNIEDIRQLYLKWVFVTNDLD